VFYTVAYTARYQSIDIQELDKSSWNKSWAHLGPELLGVDVDVDGLTLVQLEYVLLDVGLVLAAMRTVIAAESRGFAALVLYVPP
jgi:hypothetical protein